MKNKRSRGVFVTQYSLMLYMLIDGNWKNTVYLWNSTRIEPYIKSNMKTCGAKYMIGELCDDIGFKKGNLHVINLVRNIMNVFYKIILKLCCNMFFAPNKYIVYGQDHAYLADLFFGYKFILIEDGTVNYMSKKEIIDWFSKYAPALMKKIIPAGLSNAVDEIYLSGRKEIRDEIIRKKAKIFDLKKCWDKKTEKENEEILFVFGYDYDRMNEIIASGRDVFVLTQNLSAFYCSEEDQINIYKSLIRDIDKRRVVIKPHPVDKIKYERYFPDCMVLRANFPFELIYFMNFPVKKIIALSSTSIYGLWDDSIIESHEDVYHNLLKHANEVDVYEK